MPNGYWVVKVRCVAMGQKKARSESWQQGVFLIISRRRSGLLFSVCSGFPEGAPFQSPASDTDWEKRGWQTLSE